MQILEHVCKNEFCGVYLGAGGADTNLDRCLRDDRLAEDTARARAGLLKV